MSLNRSEFGYSFGKTNFNIKILLHLRKIITKV